MVLSQRQWRPLLGLPLEPKSWVLCLTAVAFVGLAACSKKADVKAQSAALEKAFPGAAAAQAAQVDPGAPQPAADANALVSAALSSVKKDDYAGGVIALQHVVETRNVTAEQLMTVEQTRQALVQDLMRRADAGDARAKAALSAIERTKSQ